MLCKRPIAILLTCLVGIAMQDYLLVTAYTQVSSNRDDKGPKIYKALNLDLIYPKSFNTSDNVISTTPATLMPSVEKGSSEGVNMDVVVDDGKQKQQQHQHQHQHYNPLPQSNEQTNRDSDADADADDAADAVAVVAAVADDDDSDKQPLYVTPTSNEAGLYATLGSAPMDSSKRNGVNNGINAQVVTANAINIQHNQRLNDNHNNNEQQQQKEQQNTATGRAVDYHTGYPFGQLITPLIKNAPRPVYRGEQGKAIVGRPSSLSSSSSSATKANNGGKITAYPQAVYRQKPPSQAEIDKYRGKGSFRDRFTPSEAVASHQLKTSNHNHHNHHQHNHHNHGPAGKLPASSNVVKTYKPPKNLYSFPPNNADYPLPNQDNKFALSNNIVNSYSAPPSGPLSTASSNDNGYKYAGPLSLSYLPTINNNSENEDTMDSEDTGNGNDNDNGDVNGSDGDNSDDDSIGVLPASAMDANDNANNMNTMLPMDMKDEQGHSDGHDDDHSYDTGKEYPTPPPEWLKAHPEAALDHPPNDHDHNEPQNDESHHDHDHYHHHPDISVDHDTFSYPFHHSIPSFPIYPDIIYDSHHDHEHHHVEPLPPPITTEAPPPEPPPEPRVKKYSYFYIGRKLWYIPLYFTVWFSFYVLWLILKSIARHKVNLPNHYVARRSVDNYNLSKSQQETINQLTVSVLDKIENFKRLYVN